MNYSTDTYYSVLSQTQELTEQEILELESMIDDTDYIDDLPF